MEKEIRFVFSFFRLVKLERDVSRSCLSLRDEAKRFDLAHDAWVGLGWVAVMIFSAPMGTVLLLLLSIRPQMGVCEGDSGQGSLVQ